MPTPPIQQELIQQSQSHPVDRIAELKKLFVGRTHVYIDYANISPACARLGWSIDLQRLKSTLDATGSVKRACVYYGTILGDKKSEGFTSRIRKSGFELRTKPVKFMDISIDASSVPVQSPIVLSSFIKQALMRQLRVETIEHLNLELLALNKLGTKSLQIMKCNFDMEIASDMRLDHALGKPDTYCLWSGDSDFADPVICLLLAGRKVIIVARNIATELNDLRHDGLIIFDVRKLRDLICRR